MDKLITLVAFSILLLVPAGIDDTFADSEQTDIPVSISCTGSGQLCVPLFSTIAETQSELKVKFTASSGHCSSVAVNIFLDGNPVGTTGFLGWTGAPSPFDVLPLMSGIVDLGPVAPGTYEIGLQGEGQVSGCNLGELGGWGGTLTIFSKSIESQAVGGKQLQISIISLLLAGAQSITWLLPVVLSIAGFGLVLVQRNR